MEDKLRVFIARTMRDNFSIEDFCGWEYVRDFCNKEDWKEGVEEFAEFLAKELIKNFEIREKEG